MAAAFLKTFPYRESFARLCGLGRAVPLRAEIDADADTETPISAFLKLSRSESRAFLVEAVEGGERSGRWSFLGARPRSIYSWKLGQKNDPLAYIEAELGTHRAIPVNGTPHFSGGLIGYIAYDAVCLFEPRVPIAKAGELGFPDVLLMDFDTIVAFDNLRHSVHVIAEVRCNEGDLPDALYEQALRRIRRVITRSLARTLDAPRPPVRRSPSELFPRVSREAFEEAMRHARDYICDDDCQQIVLSQRFDAEVDVDPFEISRALRRVNPSPYLYLLKDGDTALVGSSPETLVRLEGGEITLRPPRWHAPPGRYRARGRGARGRAQGRSEGERRARHACGPRPE